MSEIRILALVDNGSEEIELVVCVDLWRRAGFHVIIASSSGELIVTCSRQTKIIADTLLEEVMEENFDLVYLPGGIEGANNFLGNEIVMGLLRRRFEIGEWISAICASPKVLHQFSSVTHNTQVVLSQIVGEEVEMTCYPGLADERFDCGREVVESGKVMTSQGVGTAHLFALHLIQTLDSLEKKQEIQQQTIYT